MDPGWGTVARKRLGILGYQTPFSSTVFSGNANGLTWGKKVQNSQATDHPIASKLQTVTG